MPSNHIQRINDDIRRTLASLLREVKDPRVQQGDLLSIVRTETTGRSALLHRVSERARRRERKRAQKGSQIVQRLAAARAGHLALAAVYAGADLELDHSIEHGAHINDIIRHLDDASPRDGENG